MIINKIKSNNFDLNFPIKIEVEEKTDGYMLANKELNIYVYSPTIEQAVSEFEEVLYSIYEIYNNTPDNQLTLCAKELKDKLIAVIKPVKQ